MARHVKEEDDEMPQRFAHRDQLAPKEIAQLVGLSYHAILRAIDRGDLEACEPVPGRLRIERAEYERWRQQPRRQKAPPPAPVRRYTRRARRATTASFIAELRAIEEGEHDAQRPQRPRSDPSSVIDQ